MGAGHASGDQPACCTRDGLYRVRLVRTYIKPQAAASIPSHACAGFGDCSAQALERAVHFRSVCTICRGYTWTLFSLVGSCASTRAEGSLCGGCPCGAPGETTHAIDPNRPMLVQNLQAACTATTSAQVLSNSLGTLCAETCHC